MATTTGLQKHDCVAGEMCNLPWAVITKEWQTGVSPLFSLSGSSSGVYLPAPKRLLAPLPKNTQVKRPWAVS